MTHEVRAVFTEDEDLDCWDVTLETLDGEELPPVSGGHKSLEEARPAAQELARDYFGTNDILVLTEVSE